MEWLLSFAGFLLGLVFSHVLKLVFDYFHPKVTGVHNDPTDRMGRLVQLQLGALIFAPCAFLMLAFGVNDFTMFFLFFSLGCAVYIQILEIYIIQKHQFEKHM